MNDFGTMQFQQSLQIQEELIIEENRKVSEGCDS